MTDMNNDNFSTARFVQVFKLYMHERMRSLTMQGIVMAALTAMVIFLCCWGAFKDAYSPDAYFGGNSVSDPMCVIMLMIYVAMIIAFGAIICSQAADGMQRKAGRLVVLMTPATQFEKYLTRWIVCTPVYLIVFTLMFILMDTIRVAAASAMYPQCTYIQSTLSMFFNGKVDIETTVTIALVTLSIMSFYLLGSFFWPKNAFVKTAVASIAFILITIFVAALIQPLWWGDMHYSDDGTSTRNILWISMTILTLLCWTLGYLRFRQDEVIQRW